MRKCNLVDHASLGMDFQVLVQLGSPRFLSFFGSGWPYQIIEVGNNIIICMLEYLLRDVEHNKA